MDNVHTNVLEVSNLHAYYGDSHILHGINLSVAQGELVCLLGRNGSGRTTTLRAIMGLTGKRTGQIRFAGRSTMSLAPHSVARLGIGYCPEERGIFASLSTEENLLLPPVVAKDGLGLDEIYKLFPNLLERKNSPAGRLSGGEQQMLALARILRTGARTLLLDEITEGLAPVIVQALEAAVVQLKLRGFTIVMAEQNFNFASKVADRHYVLDRGNIAMSVTSTKLDSNRSLLDELLGV
ncbi:ATP-binding cassette domain-containing protein [Paraburkholderia sp. CNPSo 3157]|uniref:ATP-binding cassette domain-containing protein n=1 Tax=Paraburkholderia franconis TaxID=2654983 RepID=A0A7X1ND16_9BURK|nr:ABC transporter ATP-binding protein [Paraburkholderia franconis]MPW19253.1 ATP-binding cassette domain-containing protein [Paraburkholderia franconis]